MHRTVRALVALIAALILLPAQPANAVSDADLRAALNRVTTSGVMTSEDRAIIATDPEVAAGTIDPSLTTVTVTERPAIWTGPFKRFFPARAVDPAPPNTMMNSNHIIGPVATVRCGELQVQVNYRSFPLRVTVYKFIHNIGRCWNGTRITRIYSRYFFLRDVSYTASFKGLIVNKQSGTGTERYVSTMQARFEHCYLKYGCVGSTYPYVQIRLYGTGTWAYTREV